MKVTISMASEKGNNTASPLQGLPEYSVIITCYYEEDSIEEFYSRLSQTLVSSGRSYEIIFVNDGSTDKTFDKLKAIYEKDSQVTAIVDLFRNVGQLGAMTAGISQARGKQFVFIDSDLQLDVEELPLLMAEFDKGFDIVSGCRKGRKDPLARKLTSKVANMIMRRVSGHKISDFGCTFKIYDGRLIRAFEFGPYKQFQTAYVYSRANTSKEIPVTHHPRKYGKSGWTFKSLSSFLMDNLVGMSKRPFQFLSLICFLFAGVFLVRVLTAWVLPFSILPEIEPGLILYTILLHLLITIAILALIGEYVIRNYISLRKYPIYIIRDIFKRG
jgi:undecaprenyl-phosphate 4-deoxy-4-formamido-L-arabinose transferase